MRNRPARGAQSGPVANSTGSTASDNPESPRQLTFGPAPARGERPFFSICFDAAVPGRLKLIWMALASACRVWAGDERIGRCDMSIPRLAALCDVHKRQARRLLHDLLELPCLRRETVGTGRRRSRFALLPDAIDTITTNRGGVHRPSLSAADPSNRGGVHRPPLSAGRSDRGGVHRPPLGGSTDPPVGGDLGGDQITYDVRYVRGAASPAPQADGGTTSGPSPRPTPEDRTPPGVPVPTSNPAAAAATARASTARGGRDPERQPPNQQQQQQSSEGTEDERPETAAGTTGRDDAPAAAAPAPQATGGTTPPPNTSPRTTPETDAAGTTGRDDAPAAAAPAPQATGGTTPAPSPSPRPPKAGKTRDDDGTPVAAPPTHPGRVEGLVAVIALRSRKAKAKFDEGHCRRLLTAGKLTVHQLQERADALQGIIDRAGRRGQQHAEFGQESARIVVPRLTPEQEAAQEARLKENLEADRVAASAHGVLSPADELLAKATARLTGAQPPGHRRRRRQ